MSLPGGEKYLQAFKDKQTLIRLDRKMQNNEGLSNDELRFLYELDRPIVQLDTYGVDTRIQELKDRYGLEYALEKGIKADDIVSKLYSSDIVKNLDTLVSQC